MPLPFTNIVLLLLVLALVVACGTVSPPTTAPTSEPLQTALPATTPIPPSTPTPTATSEPTSTPMPTDTPAPTSTPTPTPLPTPTLEEQWSVAPGRVLTVDMMADESPSSWWMDGEPLILAGCHVRLPDPQQRAYPPETDTKSITISQDGEFKEGSYMVQVTGFENSPPSDSCYEVVATYFRTMPRCYKVVYLNPYAQGGTIHKRPSIARCYGLDVWKQWTPHFELQGETTWRYIPRSLWPDIYPNGRP